jgi:phosphoenolpyruvate synthase/pyruvate phosphate dikinase
VDLGILAHDPFEVLDQDGVGELIKFAVERGRATRPDLKIGICGEQGGEPRTVAFLHEVCTVLVGGLRVTKYRTACSPSDTQRYP